MPRYQNYHVWTELDITLLRSEAALKKTASQISLNWKYVSRFSVLNQCKIHGIKLLWKAPKKKPKPNPGQHGPLSINFERKYCPILPESFPVKNPISFVDRPHNSCGWIVNDPRKLLCCGAPTDGVHFYCPDHCKIAYVPIAVRLYA